MPRSKALWGKVEVICWNSSRAAGIGVERSQKTVSHLAGDRSMSPKKGS